MRCTITVANKQRFSGVVEDKKYELSGGSKR
jgi:hypothetical protein